MYFFTNNKTSLYSIILIISLSIFGFFYLLPLYHNIRFLQGKLDRVKSSRTIAFVQAESEIESNLSDKYAIILEKMNVTEEQQQAKKILQRSMTDLMTKTGIKIDLSEMNLTIGSGNFLFEYQVHFSARYDQFITFIEWKKQQFSEFKLVSTEINNTRRPPENPLLEIKQKYYLLLQAKESNSVK